MDEFRKLWQNQEVEPIRISIDELRTKAAKFQRRILWRNAREQVACLFVVLMFGAMCVKAPQTVLRIACVLVIGGAIYIAWHIHVWGRPTSLPADMGRANCAEFYRRELEGQRDLLSSIWKWYLGPLAPGMAVFVIYGIVASPPQRRWFPVAYAISALAMFWIIGHINQRAAKRLAVQISELDFELDDV